MGGKNISGKTQSGMRLNCFVAMVQGDFMTHWNPTLYTLTNKTACKSGYKQEILDQQCETEARLATR